MVLATASPAFSMPVLPTPVPETLSHELRSALEHARRLTIIYGVTAPEVAVAWDWVEELQTAIARRREQPPSDNSAETNFNRYCSLNPEAPECRIYDL